MSGGQEPQRQLPTSTVQVAGQAATDVIGGLKQQPMLLGLVVLNMIGIGAGVWVLKDLSAISNTRFSEVVELTQKCFEHLSKPKE